MQWMAPQTVRVSKTLKKKVVFTMFKIDDYKHDKVNPAQLKKMNLTAQKTHMEINDKKTIALFELDVTRVPPRLK